MKFKNLLAILLCMAMIVGVVPLIALADEEDCAHINAYYTEPKGEATCFESAVGGYWFCEDCWQYLDEDKQNAYWDEREVLNAVKIPATGHYFNTDTGVCDECGLANPVYTKVTSLDDVNEEDMYIIVAEVAGAEGTKYFVLGGLDERHPDEQGNVWCPTGVSNAIQVTANSDGSISLVDQEVLEDGSPSEFMLDVNPEQFGDMSWMGLTTIMLKLPNHCVYPFQSYSHDNNGYMGVSRYADEYGMWDSSEWVIDFYTTVVTDDTYRYEDEFGSKTHAEQVADGNIDDNITEGNLLLYKASFYSVGGAMFTLRLREYNDQYYFISGEDWCLEGSDGWDYVTDTTPTNDIQYAVSLYRYDVPEVETHTCEFDEWKEDVGSNTHSRSCACGKSETLSCAPGNWATAGTDNHTRSCSTCGRIYSAPHGFSTTYTKVDGSYHKSICTTAGCTESKLERHTYGEWVANDAGTEERRECTANGCDAYETRVIHQHSYGEWTDEGNGNHIRICTAGDGCADTQREPHDWSEFTKFDAEYHIHSCNTCHSEEKIAHSFGEGVVTDESDNHNEGTMTYTCDVCNHAKEESIPKLPDEFINTDAGITLDVPQDGGAFIPVGTVIDVVQLPTTDVNEQILGEIAIEANGAAKPLAIYDLALLLNGAEIQPNGTVVINLPAPDLATEYDNLIVIYIAPDGSYEECPTTMNKDGTISFETDHFSRYAVIGITENTPENTPEKPETPENPGEPDNTIWIIISVVGVALVGGAVAFVFYIRTKKLTPTAPEAQPEDSDKKDEEEKADNN